MKKKTFIKLAILTINLLSNGWVVYALLPCPEGYHLDADKCVPCPGGTYWVRGDCYLCPAGTFSLPGSIDLGQCRSCPVGFYSAKEGSPICDSCGKYTTTLHAGASSASECECAPGYKIDESFGHDIPLHCNVCDKTEWCLPGDTISYWSLEEFCIPHPQYHMCIGHRELRERRSKCLIEGQCPNPKITKIHSYDCLYPYQGFKCNECLPNYGKSLLNQYQCISCLYHYITFSILIIIISLLVFFIQNEISKKVILLRIFLTYYQHLSLLKYLNPDLRHFLNVFLFGIPFYQIFYCFIKVDLVTNELSPIVTIIQILTFFPLILILWSLILSGVISFFSKRVKDPLRANQSKIQFKRRLTSISPKVFKSVFGLRFLGIFTFLYFISFVNFTMPFFQVLKCITVESSGHKHVFQALDIECDALSYPELRRWGLSGIILWIWVLPLIWIIWLLLRPDLFNSIKYRTAFGFYATSAPSWPCFYLLRLLLMMTIIGAPGPFEPAPLFAGSANWLSYTFWPTPETEVGTLGSGLWSLFIFILGEIVREIYSVGISPSSLVLNFLIRFSSLTVIMTWISVLLNKAAIGGGPQYRSDSIQTQLASIMEMAHFELDTDTLFKWSSFINTFTAILHVVLLTFLFGLIIRCILKDRRQVVDNDTLDVGSDAKIGSSKVATKKSTKWASDSPYITYCINVLLSFPILNWWKPQNSNNLAPTPAILPSAPLDLEVVSKKWIRHFEGMQSLRRSKLINVATKQDVKNLLAAINLSNELYQAIAALLNITLKPFPITTTARNCLELLRESGFETFAIEDTVNAFIDVRARLLERLSSDQMNQMAAKKGDSLAEPASGSSGLGDAWLTSRQLGVLRYPVLEDSNLQLVPPLTLGQIERRLRRGQPVKRVGRQSQPSAAEDIFSRSFAASRSKSPYDPYESREEGTTLWSSWLPTLLNFLVSGRAPSRSLLRAHTFAQKSGHRSLLPPQEVARFSGSMPMQSLVMSKGRVGSPDKDRQLFDVPHNVTTGTSADPFLQDLSQRVLHCLILDLSDQLYQVPREVPLDRYLASGVPAGTRNDGRSDALVRYYHTELLKRKQARPLERPQEAIQLEKILRTRQEEAKRREARRPLEPVSEAVTYAERFSPELEKKRELNHAFQLTSQFCAIFPDARPALSSETGERDATPDPARLFEDLAALFTARDLEMSAQQALLVREESENFETFVSRCLRYIGDFLNSIGQQEEVVGEEEKTELPKPSTSPSTVKLSPLLVPLLSLTVFGDSLSIEPEEVTVFASENIKYNTLRGPCGGPTCIDTEDSNFSMILLDPIIEILPSDPLSVLEKYANWSLECSVYLKPSTSVVVGGQSRYRSLSSSSEGDTAFTIEESSGRFGVIIKNSTFEAYGSEGALLEALTIRDIVPQSAWIHVIVTANVRHREFDDLTSPIDSLLHLYINANLAGRLMLNDWVFKDLECLGNNIRGGQPFGAFSSLSLWPSEFSHAQVKERYRKKK